MFMVISVMPLLGAQNDFPFMYGGAVAGPDIGNWNKSTLVGVAKERSYPPPSIVSDWEKKSCSFCIFVSASAREALLACLCLDCGGVAVWPVTAASERSDEAFLGVLFPRYQILLATIARYLWRDKAGRSS